MKVLVISEVRLCRGPDGTIRALSDGRGYHFWTRYLTAFEKVEIVARVKSTCNASGIPVEGPHVSVAPIPDFLGPMGLAKSFWQVRCALSGLVIANPENAVIARVPGTLGTLIHMELQRRKLPLALEVVGDPRTAFEAASGPSLIRRSSSLLGAAELRRQCRRALAVSYVTREALQALYPPAPDALTASYSSVELPEAAFREPKKASDNPRTIIAVGTLEQPYKGFDVLIDALAALPNEVTLRIVGGGQLRGELERRAQLLGLSRRVTYAGQLATAAEVRDELDQADVFVMPSRAEGLPRALLEAMARGLPCVGSRVGGIPELLRDDEMVPPGDVSALAYLLSAVLSSRERRQQMAHRNYEIAIRYRSSVLDDARRKFYQGVRERVSAKSQPTGKS